MQKLKDFKLEQEQIEKQFAYIEKVSAFLYEKDPEKLPLAHIHSYGCQQNVADGEKLQGMLSQMGYGFTDLREEADLIIYNTCAIREHAEAKVFGNIGALKHLKARKPDLIVGVCGCMPQQEHIVQRIKNSYPHVDLLFGTHSLHAFPEILFRQLSENKRVFDVRQTDGVVAEGLPIKRDGDLKGWLSIMYGCNNFCTYCIVPYVRGRERSREPEDILTEFRSMLKQGFKDITLLGQNVNSYGRTLNRDIDFVKLLDMLAGEPGEFRLRFMTSHPRDFSKELVDVIAKHPKIVNQIHLPVQSGNNKVLKAMNRHYTVEDYLKNIEYAKEKIPDVHFTSDIIVGFPGETYEEFKDTMELVDKVKFSSLFIFIFSKRKGTKAYDMEDFVPYEEKTKWFQELQARQKTHTNAFYKDQVGNTLRVLVEGEGKSGKAYMSGKADNGITVDFLGERDLIGKFVNVKVTQPLNFAVLGEIEHE